MTVSRYTLFSESVLHCYTTTYVWFDILYCGANSRRSLFSLLSLKPKLGMKVVSDLGKDHRIVFDWKMRIKDSDNRILSRRKSREKHSKVLPKTVNRNQTNSGFPFRCRLTRPIFWLTDSTRIGFFGHECYEERALVVKNLFWNGCFE